MKVAGVKCPELRDIHYEIHPFNAFVKPAWYIDGVRILKELTKLGIESEVYKEKRRILDYQRKKTTQKVNLYERSDPGLRRSHPQDQTFHGRRREPQQSFVENREATP